MTLPVPPQNTHSVQKTYISVATSSRIRPRIIKRTQTDAITLVRIRRDAEFGHLLIHLVLAIRRVTRVPQWIGFLSNPLQVTRRRVCFLAIVIQNRGTVTEVNEVDEDGAGGGGASVRQETVVGVYVDGLRGRGVLNRRQLCVISTAEFSLWRCKRRIR